MKNLTIELFQNEAKIFSQKESAHKEPSLFGVTDGKAVGTYIEHMMFLGLVECVDVYKEYSDNLVRVSFHSNHNNDNIYNTS